MIPQSIREMFGIACVYFFLIIPASWFAPEVIGSITGNIVLDVAIWAVILIIAFEKLDDEAGWHLFVGFKSFFRQ